MHGSHSILKREIRIDFFLRKTMGCGRILPYDILPAMSAIKNTGVTTCGFCTISAKVWHGIVLTMNGVSHVVTAQYDDAKEKFAIGFRGNWHERYIQSCHNIARGVQWDKANNRLVYTWAGGNLTAPNRQSIAEAERRVFKNGMQKGSCRIAWRMGARKKQVSENAVWDVAGIL